MLSELLADLPGGHPGCLIASYCYQDRLFDREVPVLAALGVPDGWRAVGTIALGHPAPVEPGRSAGRGRPALDDVVHRGGW